MVISKIIKHETYILIGALIAIGVIIKIFFKIFIDSDWFWFLAAVGLILEGIMNLSKDRKFNQKFKVVSKEEFEEFKNWKNK